MNRYRNYIVAIASVSVGLLAAAEVRAASCVKVNQSDWWAGTTGHPSYVNMYIYVPDKVATKPPIVVAPHHCQGTGTSTCSEMSGVETVANSTGFIMIFPEATGENCWDAGSTRSLKHGGGGDTGAIVQMVKYTLSKYNGDAGRVYSVGASSGGIMTEALLGVYPDIFIAGVSLMGVPCGCWASSYNDVTGNGSTAQWSGPCAGGTVTHTGKEWGDLVRSYYSGYTGHRPRLQHWHGTADTTLNYKNMAEDIKEWTNLFGLSETPTGSDTPKSGTTRQYWKNSCGYTVYETFALSGVGHAVGVDAAAITAYFGIDKVNSADPETAACGGGEGGTSSAGGTTSVGGTTSAGGVTSAGGRTSTGGTANGGGRPATGGASNAPTGGSSNAPTGGRTSSGSSVVTLTGGAPNTGGVPATGGRTTGLNPIPTGGSNGVGGANGTGGAAATTGNTSVASNSGGALGVGGTATENSNSTTPPVSNTGDSTKGGCGCVVAGKTRSSGSAVAVFLLAALGLAVRRQPRGASRARPFWS